MQTAAADPVVLARSRIFSNLNDQITQDEPIFETQAMQITRGLGHLQKLPRELRDQIYGYAVTNGTTALLCASRRIEQEAKPLISQNGIYRLRFGFDPEANHPLLTRPLANEIQNFTIRFYARKYWFRHLDPLLPELRQFDGRTVERKQCLVTIVCNPFFNGMYSFESIRSLSFLVTFERVIVKLDLQLDGRPWPDVVKDFGNDHVLACAKAMLHHQKEILKPMLGTGYFLADGKRHCLVFYPPERGLRA